MKYISVILIILLMLTTVGCHNAVGNIYEISSFLGEKITSAANDIDNSKLPETPEFSVSVPSFSDMPEEAYIAEYTHFISNMDSILVEETWYEAEADGSQPAGDPAALCFKEDGTGSVWLKVGDGGTMVMFFTYEPTESNTFILTDNNKSAGSEYSERVLQPLEDTWKEISLTMDMWFGTNEYILYITLADGTVKKYYSDTAEIMEDGSIKYSDGTVSPSDIFS